MTDPLDLDAIKARLSEYDDALPRCPGKVARNINCAPDHLPSEDPTYPDYVLTTYSPCCRPEGHAGECRNSRSVMGWPGFVTVSALVAEVERLRGEADRERGVVVTYLTYRAEMTYYNDAAREFINAADEVANGVHHTIDYDEVLP